jgi:hypothetical protein
LKTGVQSPKIRECLKTYWATWYKQTGKVPI